MNLIFRLAVSAFYLLCGTTIVSSTLHSDYDKHKNACLIPGSVCIAACYAEESAPTGAWWFGAPIPRGFLLKTSLITFEHSSPKQRKPQSWGKCS